VAPLGSGEPLAWSGGVGRVVVFWIHSTTEKERAFTLRPQSWLCDAFHDGGMGFARAFDIQTSLDESGMDSPPLRWRGGSHVVAVVVMPEPTQAEVIGRAYQLGIEF